MKKFFALFLGLLLFFSWSCPSMVHANMKDNFGGVSAEAGENDIDEPTNYTDCCPETPNTQDNMVCIDGILKTTPNNRLALKKLTLKPIGKFVAHREFSNFPSQILSRFIPKPHHFAAGKSPIQILRSMVLLV